MSSIEHEVNTSRVLTATAGTAYSSVTIDGGVEFVSSNICAGKTIFGRTGAAVCVTGTANTAAADVLTGKTFWNAAGGAVTGTMTNVGAVDLSATSPSVAGYYSGFSNGSITAASLCSGARILGTNGTAICVTGTATTSAADVLSGKTFWNAAGGAVTGTMANQGTLAITDATTTSWSSGYYSSITLSAGSNLAAGNICSSNTILGVGGTAVCQGAVGSGTIAVSSNICSGSYAYGSSGVAINGSRVCSKQPSEISGLTIWLKADAITGLNDADPVTNWTDSSGANISFTQATSTKQPTYRTNVINALPVVRFDSTDDLLKGSTATSVSTATVFVVLSQTSSGSGSTYTGRYIIGKSASGSSNDFVLSISSSNNINTYYESSSGSASSLGIRPITLSSPTLVVVNGGISTVLQTVVNGVPAAVDSVTSVTFSNSNWGLGRDYTEGYGAALGGDIGELILYNSALSEANRIAVSCYLSAKWGLSVPGCG